MCDLCVTKCNYYNDVLLCFIYVYFSRDYDLSDYRDRLSGVVQKLAVHLRICKVQIG